MTRFQATRAGELDGRRRFLQRMLGAAAMAGPFGAAAFPALLGNVLTASTDETSPAAAAPRLPVAGVVTVYRRNSHADVILGKILEGYQQDGGPGPGLRLASLYVDQSGKGDLARDLAQKHGFPICESIDQALTLGSDELQVAGVLSIGEHGDYPFTPDTRQHMYPRRRFFEEIVATFRRVKKTAPVFNDKHLSYRWDDARFMVETARAMKFPLLAGSSVPVAWRLPPLQLERDCEIESAVSVGYGGFEAYGFHALEAHQSLIERRRGGESGVASVQAVRGPALLEAAAAGRWSLDLFKLALAAAPQSRPPEPGWEKRDGVAGYLIEHRDGLKSAVIMASGLARHFSSAVQLKNRADPLVTWFKLQEGAPYGHFAYLVRAIEHMVRSGRHTYPVERTLLTTGVLDRVMKSLAEDGRSIATPELAISYSPVDWPFANDPKSDLQLPND